MDGTQTTANAVQVFEGHIRVQLDAAGHTVGDFHHRWLRHNAPGDVHPITGERTLCSSEIVDEIAPEEALLEKDGTLVVRWNDGSPVARYPRPWLRQHAYALNRHAVPPPPANVDALLVDAPGDWDTLVDLALQRVWQHGAVVLRGVAPGTPPQDATQPLLDAFSRSGHSLVETHFGRVEDLRTDNTTNTNTDQLGYTDAAIDLHTDQPFLEQPPRYQLLQAIRPADVGGESVLVDAKQASAYFRSIHAEDHALLTRIPVCFHRRQKAFEKVFAGPLLVDTGNTFQVRSSYFTMAPHQVAFEHMTAWYRAHDGFFRVVRNPRHQYRFRLDAGDLVLYDNFRMLHGRTAFSGPRWLRGIYLNPPPARSHPHAVQGA